MVHADKIHKWLSQPDSFSETDAAAVDALVEKYPYFIPGRYLQVIRQGKGSAFTPPVLNRMHLFMGNWLLYYRTMQEQAAPASTDIAPEMPVAGQPMDALAQLTEVQTPEVNDHKMSQDQLITPVYTEDYFLHEGIRVSDEIPEEPLNSIPDQEEKDKSLMVVMSFSEWLAYFKKKSEKERQEEEGRKALKTMWQKEKLAAALEEEADEIPDEVFNMAVNSITREDGLVSESLAEILVRQGKYEKAIDMYQKLSLRNPQKNAYFVARIEQIQKEMKL